MARTRWLSRHAPRALPTDFVRQVHSQGSAKPEFGQVVNTGSANTCRCPGLIALVTRITTARGDGPLVGLRASVALTAARVADRRKLLDRRDERMIDVAFGDLPDDLGGRLVRDPERRVGRPMTDGPVLDVGDPDVGLDGILGV